MSDSKKPNLAVTIGRIRMKNPVTVASGCFGYGKEYGEGFVDLKRMGAITTKTITPKPRLGNPPIRIAETSSGMLNSIGLQNPGIDGFLKEKLPYLQKAGTPIIASISGESVDQFVRLAERLSAAKGIEGLELNVSCPNIKKGGMEFGNDPPACAEVVRAVKKATRLTVITKLSPNVTNIVLVAKAAQDAGTDAISLINTLVGMAVDLEKRKPILSSVTGGLSGPAIKPVALRMVWQVHRAVKVPLIGMGGIMNARDALEFILCGASAVALGTANFVNPHVVGDVINGIESYLKQHRIGKIQELVGALQVES